MFSALKKLTGNRGSPGGGVNGQVPSGGDESPCNGIHAMPSALQKKFGKGVHYNMKLLLRGDIATGKTTLFRRLQGAVFSEEYTQVSNL